MTKTILKDGLLIDPTAGREEVVSLIIESDQITKVLPRGAEPQVSEGDTLIDATDLWIVPGLVDLSCALREPGYEQNETIATGLAAAAKGGFTAVCASPETHPVVDHAAVVVQLQDKAKAATGARLIPLGAATQGLKGDALASYGELKEHGCPGVTQGTGCIQSANMMRRALEYAKAFDVVVIHQALEPSMAGLCDEGTWSTRLGLPATPAQAELIAIERDLALAELTGGRLHLTRVSTALGLDAIRRAKSKGLQVTCDVTLHHLHLNTSALLGFDSNYKVWPPLRNQADVDALRTGLSDGTVDAITSDHRPVHLQDKALEFMQAEFGISALESALGLALDLVHGGVLSPQQAIRLMSSGPRQILGLSSGEVTQGTDADLTLIDPQSKWHLDQASMVSMGTNTPFVGREFMGRAVRTIVAGESVFIS